MAGSAAVSPPVLELSGHRFLALSWVSPNVASTFFAAARLNGCLPSIISRAMRDWLPFSFMIALRVAIGSLWAITAVIPSGGEGAGRKRRFIVGGPLLWEISRGKEAFPGRAGAMDAE